jgi:integrase
MQKSQATLSQQISETIFKHTGLTMTPHQFRHLAAKLILDENPGQYEMVRQFLAHKSTKSTMTFYAGLQTSNAARHYDQMLIGTHAQLSERYDKKGKSR